MTLDQILFLSISLVAIILFVTDWMRVDLVALLIIIALVVSRLLDEKEAFTGFSSEPAIIVAAVFVLSAGLSSTGVTDLIGEKVGALIGKSETRAILILMTTVATLSAFTHHLMITALMLPIVMKICKEKNLSASRMLIPMATAASLGTTLTLIGAPAYLLANQILKRGGQPGLGLFGPLKLGLPVVGASFVLILVLKWLLPRISGKSSDQAFEIQNVVTELTLPENSRWIGKTLAEFKTATEKRYEVRNAFRTETLEVDTRKTINEDEPLNEADIIIVATQTDELLSVEESLGLAIRAVKRYGPEILGATTTLANEKNRVMKALIAPRAYLIGKTLEQEKFLHRHGVVAVGIWRKTGWISDKVSETVIRGGDVIVLWGPEENLEKIMTNHSFLLMMPFKGKPRRRVRIPVAIAVMVLSIGTAASGFYPTYVVFLAGAIAMVLTGCVSIKEAYASIETKIFVMIAGVIPLGIAMEKTGTDKLLADMVIKVTEGWSPFGMLMAFFWLSAFLTQILSDAATVVLIAPIALVFAKTAQISPTAAVVTVTIGAIASFLTPIGHHDNLLILSPGGYRFADFLKIGLPLTALISVMTTALALHYY